MSKKVFDMDIVAKEESSMVIGKPTDKAFVLNPSKAEEFLKQDNKQFQKAMARMNKFKKQNHHSVVK